MAIYWKEKKTKQIHQEIMKKEEDDPIKKRELIAGDHTHR